MIKSTHPDFEQLIAGQPVRRSVALLNFLDEIGLGFIERDNKLMLDQPPAFLDQARIMALLEARLEPGQRANLSVEIHRTITSTNDVVMRRLDSPDSSLVVCTAEMQTAGRGRRGRHWVSPFGKNIYLTIGRFVSRELSELGGLSLVVGMQVVEVLREMGLSGISLKWPNDVLLKGAKMGGVLVELKPGERRGIGIVAGVGINLALGVEDAASIDQPWSSAEGHAVIDRNELLGILCARLISSLETFEKHGFTPFQASWEDYNGFTGMPVTIIRGEDVIHGVDAGVDRSGNLLLKTSSGLQAHNSGEVSMRPVDPT